MASEVVAFVGTQIARGRWERAMSMVLSTRQRLIGDLSAASLEEQKTEGQTTETLGSVDVLPSPAVQAFYQELLPVVLKEFPMSSWRAAVGCAALAIHDAVQVPSDCADGLVQHLAKYEFTELKRLGIRRLPVSGAVLAENFSVLMKERWDVALDQASRLHSRGNLTAEHLAVCMLRLKRSDMWVHCLSLFQTASIQRGWPRPNGQCQAIAVSAASNWNMAMRLADWDEWQQIPSFDVVKNAAVASCNAHRWMHAFELVERWGDLALPFAKTCAQAALVGICFENSLGDARKLRNSYASQLHDELIKQKGMMSPEDFSRYETKVARNLAKLVPMYTSKHWVRAVSILPMLEGNHKGIQTAISGACNHWRLATICLPLYINAVKPRSGRIKTLQDMTFIANCLQHLHTAGRKIRLSQEFMTSFLLSVNCASPTLIQDLSSIAARINPITSPLWELALRVLDDDGQQQLSTAVRVTWIASHHGRWREALSRWPLGHSTGSTVSCIARHDWATALQYTARSQTPISYHLLTSPAFPPEVFLKYRSKLPRVRLPRPKTHTREDVAKVLAFVLSQGALPEPHDLVRLMRRMVREDPQNWSFTIDIFESFFSYTTHNVDAVAALCGALNAKMKLDEKLADASEQSQASESTKILDTALSVLRCSPAVAKDASSVFKLLSVLRPLRSSAWSEMLRLVDEHWRAEAEASEREKTSTLGQKISGAALDVCPTWEMAIIVASRLPLRLDEGAAKQFLNLLHGHMPSKAIVEALVAFTKRWGPERAPLINLVSSLASIPEFPLSDILWLTQQLPNSSGKDYRDAIAKCATSADRAVDIVSVHPDAKNEVLAYLTFRQRIEEVMACVNRLKLVEWNAEEKCVVISEIMKTSAPVKPWLTSLHLLSALCEGAGAKDHHEVLNQEARALLFAALCDADQPLLAQHVADKSQSD